MRGTPFLTAWGKLFYGNPLYRTLPQEDKEKGSITLAAKAMEMSYKHAWDLVDSMNNQAGRASCREGHRRQGRRGARLTEAGEKAVKLFHEFNADLQEFLKKEEEKFK